MECQAAVVAQWKPRLEGRGVRGLGCQTGRGEHCTGPSPGSRGRSGGSPIADPVFGRRSPPLDGASHVLRTARGTAFFERRGNGRPGKERRTGLGRVALEYESRLLGFSEKEAKEEMLRRWDIMAAAVDRGLEGRDLKMSLLRPSAGRILEAEGKGRPGARRPRNAGCRPGLGCPPRQQQRRCRLRRPDRRVIRRHTGGHGHFGRDKKVVVRQVALALFAASAVGLVISRRATFAAEVAGCQVEIGAAGAMAAAAAVEALGGSADMALDAAAVSLQNSMGSVCDLVKGLCEIPVTPAMLSLPRAPLSAPTSSWAGISTPFLWMIPWTRYSP